MTLLALRELPRQSTRRRLRVANGSTLALVGLALWLLTVANARFLEMGAWGLVSVLGGTYYVGLAVVAIGFAYELLRTPLRPKHLVACVAVLVVYLFGTASAIEPVAALSDSWLIAGFTQYIVLHGHALNNFDARFSWPGGLTLGAILTSFVGKANAYDFLRWFPLVIELIYLAPLMVIARFSGVSRRAGWLGIALYYATNWIYQDYFSPQALDFLFYLVVIATVLAVWQPKVARRRRMSPNQWWERFSQTRDVVSLARITGSDAVTQWRKETTLVVLGLLGLICLAASMSHQLTPFALVLALGACLVTRRLGRPELVVAAAVLALGWLSLGASNFWEGHLNLVIGSAGQIGSTVGSNVTNRVTGSSSHVYITELRILLTGGIFLLAGIGVLRRYASSRVLEILAAIPFVLVLLQSYAGEGFLRVVLYGLPFTALLAASAILPSETGTIRSIVPRVPRFHHSRAILRALVVVVLLGFALATTVSRGGNDSYEAFSKGELAAVQYAYKHVQAGQRIGSINYFLPIEFQDINSVNIFSVDSGGQTVRADEYYLLSAAPRFIILSQSQEEWGELVAGYRRGWEASVEQSLIEHGYNIVAYWTTATVLEHSRK